MSNSNDRNIPTLDSINNPLNNSLSTSQIVKDTTNQKNTGNNGNGKHNSNDDDDSNTNYKVNTGKLDDILLNTQKLNSVVSSINNLRNSSVELSVNYEELIYFQRMVKPILDTTYFLALSLQGASIASQSLNSINVAKPKQVEASVNLAYTLVKEVDCLLKVLTCRIDKYISLIEKTDCDIL